MSLFNKWRNKADIADRGAPEKAATAGEFDGPVQSNTAAIGRDRTVLIVDDDPIVLRAFEMKLGALGFRVVTAVDGASAMSVVHQENPDLIVLDMIFPPDVYSYGLHWDGFTIMQWLRRFKATSDIPVIAISSAPPERFEARVLAEGAVAFFQKPINQQEFLMAIRRALGKAVENKEPVPV